MGPPDPRVPRAARPAGPDVPPPPDRRDAGHQRRPGGRPGGDRGGRAGQPHGRRRRRAVDLPLPRGRLRQHPPLRRATPRRPDLPPRDELSIDAPDRRLHPGLDRAQPDRLPQGAGLGPARRRAAAGRLRRGRLRRIRLPLRADPRAARQGAGPRPDGGPLPQPLRQHPAPGRAALAGHPLHGPERPAVLRAGAHQGRAGLPADRGQPARRGLLATAPAPDPRRRPRQGRRALPVALESARPAGRRRVGRGDGAAARQEQGLLRRLRRRPPQAPGDGPRDASGRGHRRDPQGGLSRHGQAEVRAARQPDRRHRAVRPAGRQVRQPRAADRRPDPGRGRLRDGLHGRAGRDPRRPGAQHDPPGQGAGVVPRLHPADDRGELPAPTGPRRARRRGGGAADLLRGDHPGDERADAQLPAQPAQRRPGADRPHHPEPIPRRDRRGPLRARRRSSTDRAPGIRGRPSPARREAERRRDSNAEDAENAETIVGQSNSINGLHDKVPRIPSTGRRPIRSTLLRLLGVDHPGDRLVRSVPASLRPLRPLRWSFREVDSGPAAAPRPSASRLWTSRPAAASRSSS